MAAAPVGVYAVQLCQRTASRYLTAVARLTFPLLLRKTISYNIVSAAAAGRAFLSFISEIVFCDAPCYILLSTFLYIIIREGEP